MSDTNGPVPHHDSAQDSRIRLDYDLAIGSVIRVPAFACNSSVFHQSAFKSMIQRRCNVLFVTAGYVNYRI